MPAPKLTRRLFWAAEVLLLAGTVVSGRVALASRGMAAAARSSGCCWCSRCSVSRFSVEMSDGQVSASMVAIVLAMGLLGPAPAVACGIAAMILTSAVRRLSPAQWLNNLSAYASFPPSREG